MCGKDWYQGCAGAHVNPHYHDHQLSICLFICMFLLLSFALLCSVSIAYFSSFLNLIFSLITAFCCSEKTESLWCFQQTCLSNPLTTEFESEQAGKGYFSSACVHRQLKSQGRRWAHKLVFFPPICLLEHLWITLTKWKNVNITSTKGSDVHLHPATSCPLHINEPTKTLSLSLSTKRHG